MYLQYLFTVMFNKNYKYYKYYNLFSLFLHIIVKHNNIVKHNKYLFRQMTKNTYNSYNSYNSYKIVFFSNPPISKSSREICDFTGEKRKCIQCIRPCFFAFTL